MEAFGDRTVYALAVAVYGLAAAHSVLLWRREFRRGEWTNYSLLVVGFLLQGAALIGRGFSLQRCPVTNLFEAIMFVTWAVCAAQLLAGLWARLRFIGALLAPGLFVAGVFALQPQFDRPGPVFDLEHAAVSLHVTLVLLAYAGFALGAVAAVLFLLGQGAAAGEKGGAVHLASRLPPLERLELVLLRAVGMGLILLTAGLVLSLGLMRERYGVLVRPDPKIAWSFFVWAVYFGLLLARLRFGQSTRRLAWGSLAGFLFVVLTFWSTNLLSPIHHP